MGLAASLASTLQNLALTWLPVMFFLLMCFVAFLLWRTVTLELFDDVARESSAAEAVGVPQVVASQPPVSFE